jgi:hypothetical protein
MAAAGWLFAERGSKLAEAAHLSIVVLPFANLLSNAVKFTRIRKRAEIEIGCVAGSEDQRSCSSETTARALICGMSISFSACFSVCTWLKSSKALEYDCDRSAHHPPGWRRDPGRGRGRPGRDLQFLTSSGGTPYEQSWTHSYGRG